MHAYGVSIQITKFINLPIPMESHFAKFTSYPLYGSMFIQYNVLE